MLYIFQELKLVTQQGKSMRQYFVLFITLFLTLQILYAGGSSYSRYGIGDLLYFGGNRSYALGGAGLALISSDQVNIYNPAGLTKLLLTNFSSSYENTTISSQTSSYGQSKYNTFGFQTFFVAIPLSIEDGISLSLEYTPYSNIAYAIRKSGIFDSDQFISTFYGSGGLSTVAVGLSYSISNDIHTGLKIHNYFGKNEQYIKTDFENSSFLDFDVEHSFYYNGFGVTFGIIAENIGSLINVPALKPLTLGITCSPKVQLITDEKSYYPSFDTTVIVRTGKSELPFSLGIGAAYNINSSYLVVSDFLLQQWGDTKIFGQTNPTFRNSLRFGIGIEKLPERRQISFWRKTSYRIGAYYNSSYYNINGKKIDEYGFTAGLGLPNFLIGKIDIGFQYGIRGTTAYNLQKDTFYRISLGIGVQERWFLQFEEE